MDLPIHPIAADAPPRATSAFGALRVLALHSAVSQLPARLPADVSVELTDWARATAADGGGAAMGIDCTGLDADWLDALGWIGMPIARGGMLRWGEDVRIGGADGAPPSVVGDALQVASPGSLRSQGSLALKPARQFIGARLGCRLQAASGIHVFLWPHQALLVSRADVPLGGFLHGPATGQRASIAVEPGGFQALRW